MKIILPTLLAIVAFTGIASAAPQIVVNAVVTDLGLDSSKQKPQVWERLHLAVESGQETVKEIHDYTYAVTPTLQDNGTVDVAVTITHHYRSDRNTTFGPYKQSKAVYVTLGAIQFVTKATVKKSQRAATRQTAHKTLAQSGSDA